jgi:hypothetical protein
MNRPVTQTTLFRRLLLSGLLASILAFAPIAPAIAGALTDALQAGHIGERYDGYLGVVSPPGSADIRELVESTNAKRREKYAQIAKKNGIATASVAGQAGTRLLERAKPGTYVMAKDGAWTKR